MYTFSHGAYAEDSPSTSMSPADKHVLCLCWLVRLLYIVSSRPAEVQDKLNFTISISESLKPGTKVFNLHDYIGSTVTSFQIRSGNKDNRFKMWRNGTLATNGFLDSDVDDRYNLIISFIRNSQENDAMLEVNILDDSDWPPFYNSTCETPVYTGAPTYLNGYLMADVFLGKERVSGSDIRFRNLILKTDSDNGRCSFYSVVQLESYSGVHDYSVKFDQLAGPAVPVPKINTFENGDTFPKKLSKYSKLSDPIAELIFDQFSTVAPIVWLISVTRLSEDKIVYTLKSEAVIQGCPSGRYGFLCDKDCICQNGGICHGFNGACKCSKGWTGPACDIVSKVISVVPRNMDASYGQMVYLFCTYNNVKINSIYGVTWTFTNGSSITILQNPAFDIVYEEDNSRLEIDDFNEGDVGVYECSINDQEGVKYAATATVTFAGCVDNLYGAFCNKTCDCKQSSECDRLNGCVCLAGWTGETCELDVKAPNITDCPVDQTVLAEGDGGSATISWMNPTVTDNSGQPVIFGSSRESGERFSVGKHDIIMWAADQSNNTAFCNFSVMVIRPPEHVGTEVIPVYMWVIIAVAVVIILTLSISKKERRYKLLDGKDREFDDFLQENLPKAALAWNVDRAALKILNEEPIGVGEYGRVYKARLSVRGKEDIVAAKTLCETRSDAISRKNFVREIQCLLELACHPNIIPFLGIVIIGEPKYILTEYACQGDLKNYLIQLRLLRTETETLLIKVARDIANALSFMSMKGVMHKDIAARNVFLTKDFTAKIGDFGLGRDVYERLGSDYHSPTWANIHYRLPLRWMPLEYLMDGTFTLESDTWSYGILLWEIGTLGGSPMMDVPMENLLEYLRSGRRPVKPEGCTPRAYRIMQRCWKSDRYERPSPDELRAEFDNILRTPANRSERFFTAAFKERHNNRHDNELTG
ncbi:uncharacterized protein [Ptychodera flava]|uniref:uncharacterized protein n=1 Tax=Ptychodera flava TaxID=63121 RepID=UPI00396A12FD